MNSSFFLLLSSLSLLLLACVEAVSPRIGFLGTTYVEGNEPTTEIKIRFSLSEATWRFDHPFYFLVNMAVGGNWRGSPDATTKFPQRMFVDYIRVFQQ